jgi:hypothetical protein
LAHGRKVSFECRIVEIGVETAYPGFDFLDVSSNKPKQFPLVLHGVVASWCGAVL